MILSHGTRFKRTKAMNGYGYATERILASLDQLGHTVTQNDPDADAEMWFDQPNHWKWSGPYRIGYHPWESTDMRQDWKDAMNETDEIWTPSPLIANWYAEAGIHKPIYVYEHGIDHEVWKPFKREVKDTLRFLHVGGEAQRKGLDITIKAFRAAFPNNEDVELTLKMNNPGWNLPGYGKIRFVPQLLDLNGLVQLYHDHHVFIYPSWGEGFGLTPLQALGSGMPTISTGEWAPYKQLFDPYLVVDSKLVDSPWPDLHPGKMFEPNFDSLVEAMRRVYKNYRSFSWYAMTHAYRVHQKYDWNFLTNSAFSNLESRQKSLSTL